MSSSSTSRRSRRASRSRSCGRTTAPQCGEPLEVVEAVVATGVDDVDVEPVRWTLLGDRPRRPSGARSSCPNRGHRGGRDDRRRAASAAPGGTARPGRRGCPRRRARARRPSPPLGSICVGQRRQPRSVGRRDVGQRGGVTDRPDEHVELADVAGVRRVRSCRSPGADRRRGAAPDHCSAPPGTRPSRRVRAAASPARACPAGTSPAPGRRRRRGRRRGPAAGGAMRRLVLARMSSSTTPAGRWVARTRWMPRLRPRWATPTSDERNSGQLRGEGGELVDDHHQSGQRRAAGRSPGRRRGRRRRRRAAVARAGAARRRGSPAPARRGARRDRSPRRPCGAARRRRRTSPRPCSRRART